MRRTVRLMIGRRVTEFITSSSKFKLMVAAASLLLIGYRFSLDNQFSHNILLSSRPLRANYNPSCHSRLNNSHRRSTSPLQPSPYFHHKLRQYEILHSRCGPLSKSFNPTLRINPSSDQTADDCKYVVYVPFRGLGNRILALASTFLYALLTNRVLLVEFGPDMKHLFCEPFPNSSWLLPQTFSLRDQFYKSSFRDTYSYGNLLKQMREHQQQQRQNVSSSNSTAPSLVQLFLVDDYNDYDKLFFRDENQEFLQGVPWLILISTGYFLPPIFQMDSYRTELERFFPDDDDVETVFHHLGNYLFNPSDQAWKLISRFYQSYLAKADERIGFQVRVFDPKKTPPSLVMKQILSCTQNQQILHPKQNQTKAILITSLSGEFYNEMKFKYGGNSIGVYQASHEEKQQFGDDSHNMKAWVDMYLLSLSDVLVTSSMSTFGYVAAGLGGIRPWILMFPRHFVKNETELPNPACERAVNMEPCFHVPPWFAYPRQPGTVGPVIRCEDVPWGLKLAARHYNRTYRL
ncbi:Galactoside 2-alpha-L-fucosyltransferase [Linum grandiflorum]